MNLVIPKKSNITVSINQPFIRIIEAPSGIKFGSLEKGIPAFEVIQGTTIDANTRNNGQVQVWQIYNENDVEAGIRLHTIPVRVFDDSVKITSGTVKVDGDLTIGEDLSLSNDTITAIRADGQQVQLSQQTVDDIRADGQTVALNNNTITAIRADGQQVQLSQQTVDDIRADGQTIHLSEATIAQIKSVRQTITFFAEENGDLNVNVRNGYQWAMGNGSTSTTLGFVAPFNMQLLALSLKTANACTVEVALNAEGANIATIATFNANKKSNTYRNDNITINKNETMNFRTIKGDSNSNGGVIMAVCEIVEN